MKVLNQYYKILSCLVLALFSVVMGDLSFIPVALAVDTAVSIPENSPTTLSFDFQSIDIRTLLQLIAKNAGLNFVISDIVKGNITLNLKNVTWQLPAPLRGEI